MGRRRNLPILPSSLASPNSERAPMDRRGDLMTSKVLRHIRRYYREALDQLPDEEFPSLLTAGACFGLLDPVSNIIVNTAAAAGGNDGSTPSPRRDKKRKRWQRIVEEDETDRRKVLAKATLGIAKRSLDGLLAFLVCHFPYLHTREALCYLRLAKADLLVAARLIDLDRCVTTYSAAAVNPSKISVQVALKCAAISAKLPCPATVADTWLSLATSTSSDKERQLRELSPHPSLQALLLERSLTMTLGHLHMPRQLKSLWLYHKQRSRDMEKKVVYPGLTESRRCRLHDMVCRIYLSAVSNLPRDALCLHHHRSLLKAGYCFGPMNDPVSNVLLNTIWYDTVFPPEEEFPADMLCTRSLVRLQFRSAVGLIKFLCTRFPKLSENDAIVFLLEADANLHEAVSRAQREGHDASGSLEEAYMKAALAAWHPNPEALVRFVMSTVTSAALSHLRISGCSLSSKDVEAISASLEAVSGSPSCSCQSMPTKLNPYSRELVAHHQDNFNDDRFVFRGLVEDALREFTKKSTGPSYKLHIICGVNAKVPKNGKHSDYDLGDGHPYCHINFLARPRGSTLETAPKLFFVECSTDDEDTKVIRCSVVDPSTDAGRCFHCEVEGTKIVHPSLGRYLGCDTPFEEMACGEGLTITNEELINQGMRRAELTGWLHEEDSVYFDPQWDFEFAEHINKFCKADKH